MSKASTKQQGLFDERPAPAAANPAHVRRRLERVVGMTRMAERLPWSEPETRMWEKLLADLVAETRDPEHEVLLAEFQGHLVRLRAAEGSGAT